MGVLLRESDVAAAAQMTPRSVRRRACELQGERAAVAARNGHRPRVYQLESLSPKLQRAYLAQQNQVEVEQPAEPHLELALTLPGGLNLSVEDQAEALRRYRIIEAIVEPERFHFLWLQNKCQKNKLIESIAEQHQVSGRTLYTWLKAWQENGLPGLVRRDRSDKGLSKVLTGAAFDFILAAALPRPGVYGELSIREIHRAYQEEQAWRAARATKRLNEFELQKYVRYVDVNTGRLSAAAQLPAASYETFRFWYSRIPEAVKIFARKGDEAFHNTQEILSFRALADVRPMDFLVMDHRLLDVFSMVRAGQGRGWKLIRPWLTAGIDMRTRKWLAAAIVETPSSDSIASVMKSAFLQFGVPRAVYWDNGKDYTCSWLEGRQVKQGSSYRIPKLGDGMSGVLDTLGIRVHHAIIRRARSKIIEPNFVNVANFDRTLPWWCGHRASARPERLEKLIEQHERWIEGKIPDPPFPTIEQIAELYLEQIATLNERPHSGEGMSKITPTGREFMCPNEAWELLIGGVQRRTVSPEVLQFCFHKRRKLTVRNGEIRVTFDGRQHHYRLSDSTVQLMAFNGREVEFAYDPLDLGMAAIYFENRFVGLANQVELRRMDENSFVADERARRVSRREVKKFVEVVHRAVPMANPEERAARRAAVRPQRPVADAGGSITAAVPAEIAAAVEAAKKEAEFRFAEAGADLIRASDASAYRDDDPDDGGFEFFRRAE